MDEVPSFGRPSIEAIVFVAVPGPEKASLPTAMLEIGGGIDMLGGGTDTMTEIGVGSDVGSKGIGRRG